MPATIGATVAAVGEVGFSHDPVSVFHVKILSFFQSVAITIAKKVVEISHKPNFLQN